MKKITITIKKDNWKALKTLELEKDLKTHDEAIEFLFKKSKIIKPTKTKEEKKLEFDTLMENAGNEGWKEP